MNVFITQPKYHKEIRYFLIFSLLYEKQKHLRQCVYGGVSLSHNPIEHRKAIILILLIFFHFSLNELFIFLGQFNQQQFIKKLSPIVFVFR